MIKIHIDKTILDRVITNHVEGVKAYFERYEFIGSSGTCWDLVDKWMIQKIGYGFEEVLRMTFEEMRFCVDSRILEAKNYPSYILDIKNSYKKFATRSGGFGGGEKSKKWNAYELVRDLGINVCPYCNRNYITNLTKRKKRTCQLDHYFNKDKHPYFALSFYNLVPSCGPCNHIKSTNDIGINPYQEESLDHLFTFSYKGNISNPASLEFEYSHDLEMELNKSIFGIDELYETHKDFLKEILIKKESYPQSAIDEIFLKYPHLYASRDEVLSNLFSSYLKIEDYQKRPLSKMTSDILKQLKIL